MDVRCERCQTEYELEDDSVGDAGTQAQCTNCGHTFVVRRLSAANAPSAVSSGALATAAPAEESPPAAEWLLETGDGQSHRFRNLTSLQKWIIERRVTRQDRISRAGLGWRQLGDILELEPFFDVVDEADRAKAIASDRARRDLRAEAELARRTGARVQTGPGVPGLKALPPGGRSYEIQPLEAPLRVGDHKTAVVRLRGGSSGRWKPLVGLAVALGIVYLGTQVWRSGSFPSGAPRRAVLAESVHAGAATASPTPPSEAPPRPSLSPTPAPAPAGSPQVLPSAGEAAAALPATAPPEPEAELVPSAGGAPGTRAARAASGEGAGARRPGTPAGKRLAARAPEAEPPPAEGKSYQGLVEAADRSLENGATVRAMKLYDRALEANPNGIEALTGMGYVFLDRGRTENALSYFRRALKLSTYAPAIFGMAEAHRARGERNDAIAQYRRYLQISPGGVDARAAERQVAALESQPRPAAAPASAPASSGQGAAGTGSGEPSAPAASDKPSAP